MGLLFALAKQYRHEADVVDVRWKIDSAKFGRGLTGESFTTADFVAAPFLPQPMACPDEAM